MALGMALGVAHQNLATQAAALSTLNQALSAIRRNGGTALYVPDDYRGAYIDSTGTQPVTAVGDLVGLLTDRSYGASNLGVDVFSDAAVEFGGESSRVSPGVYRLYSSAGAYSAVTQRVGVIGKTYKVVFTVDSVTSAGGGIGLDIGGVPVTTFAATVGIKEAVFTYISTAAWALKRWAGVTDIQISNISVREVLGNAATQPTTASKPLVTQLANGTKALDFDGSNDSLSTGMTLGDDVTLIAAMRSDTLRYSSPVNTAGAATANYKIKLRDNGDIWVTAKNDLGSEHVLNNGIGKYQAGVPFVVTLRRTSAGLLQRRLNGAISESATGAVSGSGVNPLVIGTGDAEFQDGPIASVVAINGPVSDADLQTIERWMAHQIGAAYAG